MALIPRNLSDESRLLLAILALAFAVRVAAGVLFPSIYHPDEVIQVVEPAYRALGGNGVVAWEWEQGARSWVWPGVVAGALAPVLAVFGPGQGVQVAVVVLCSLVSLIGVASAFALGRRFGLMHAVLAAGFVALWHEMIFFGVRPFSEMVATSFLLAAVWLSSKPRTAWAFVALGAAIGVALAMRMQLAPALAIIGLWGVWRAKPVNWVLAAAGVTAPLIIWGGADWAAWGTPFHSYIENFRFNLVEDGAAREFGVSPVTQYVREIVQRDGAFLAVLAGLALMGARRAPQALAAAIVVIGVHSLIGHKEYRFIMPAVACVVMLAGLGLADLLALAGEKLGGARRASVVALAGFALASGAGAVSLQQRDFDWTNSRTLYQAFWSVKHDDFCGVATKGFSPISSPGAAQLPKGLPLYNDSAPAAAYNGLMVHTPRNPAEAVVSVPDGYSEQRCFESGGEKTCVYRREGSCSPDGAVAANRPA